MLIKFCMIFKQMNKFLTIYLLKLFYSKEYGIRYELALCKEEKAFKKLRSKVVTENLRALLGTERGPRNENETPCIGVLGSGGGYRALCGFTGALSALQELGILNCATYLNGVSGSTWWVLLQNTFFYLNCSFNDILECIAYTIKSYV